MTVLSFHRMFCVFPRHHHSSSFSDLVVYVLGSVRCFSNRFFVCSGSCPTMFSLLVGVIDGVGAGNTNVKIILKKSSLPGYSMLLTIIVTLPALMFILLCLSHHSVAILSSVVRCDVLPYTLESHGPLFR